MIVENPQENGMVIKFNVITYSTQSTPYPGSNNLNRVKPLEINDDANIYQKQTFTQANQIPTNFQYINSQHMLNNYNKTSSDYSSMTIKARSYGTHGMQFIPNPLLNNINNINIYQNNTFYRGNNIIEQRPRIIQRYQNKFSSPTSNPREAVRSHSTPSYDNYKFNRNTNVHRRNPKIIILNHIKMKKKIIIKKNILMIEIQENIPGEIKLLIINKVEKVI